MDRMYRDHTLDAATTDQRTARENGSPARSFLPAVWLGLGLLLVWLLCNAHTALALLTWLGIWHTLVRRDQRQRLSAAITRREQKRTETALREHEAHYWELFENASDLVYTCDMQGHLTSFNKAGERILGYARHEVFGENWLIS